MVEEEPLVVVSSCRLFVNGRSRTVGCRDWFKALMRSIDHRLMEESANTSSSSSSRYFSIFTNYPLISAVLAFTIAQLIKFFTTWYVYGFTCAYHSYIFVLHRIFLFRDYLTKLRLIASENVLNKRFILRLLSCKHQV